MWTIVPIQRLDLIVSSSLLAPPATAIEQWSGQTNKLTNKQESKQTCPHGNFYAHKWVNEKVASLRGKSSFEQLGREINSGVSFERVFPFASNVSTRPKRGLKFGEQAEAIRVYFTKSYLWARLKRVRMMKSKSMGIFWKWAKKSRILARFEAVVGRVSSEEIVRL